MLTDYLKQLMLKKDLSEEQCRSAIFKIIDGACPEQIAALLVLLHNKPETADELYGIVTAMQERMITLPTNETVLDIVGTGGDNANTINISTAAALVVASNGIKVAKHGNRAVSSKCGSADLLEALAIPTRLTPEQAKETLTTQGFVFLYAPDYHPATQSVKAVRQGLGVRTTFNLLGPLLNPTQPTHLIAGVSEKRLLNLYADVLLRLKVKRALVVHGSGLDEINCLGPVDVVEIAHNKKNHYRLDPKDYGFNYCSLPEIQGGNATLNCQLITNAFEGKENAISDTIAFNAGVAFHLMEITPNINEGINLAKHSLKNRTVINYLEKLRVVCHA